MKNKKNSRLVIKNGQVITLDPSLGNFERADLLIEAGKIKEIKPQLKVPGSEVIDAADMIVLPGLIDTHRHVWQACQRGIMTDWSVFDYLRVTRLHVAKFFRPEDTYVGNLLGALEAIDAGVTTVVDFCHVVNSPEHADAAVQGLKESGARAFFGYGFNDVPVEKPAFTTHEARLKDARRVRKSALPSDDERVRMWIALSEPDYFQFDKLTDEIRLARELGVRITLHIGFEPVGGGTKSITRIRDAGLIGPDMLYVHCTWASDDELQIIAKSGGAISITPESEFQMCGIPRTRQAMAYGLKPTLGNDIPITGWDLFNPMRFAVETERLLANDRGGHENGKLPETVSFFARDALEFATINGARAVGLEAKIGSLTPGKEADVVLLRTGVLNLKPALDPIGSIVLGAHPGNVDTVLIGGDVVKRHGKLVYDNLERVRGLANKSCEFILKLLEADKSLKRVVDWQKVYEK
jgi:cytosine/adenosine deaminase-related metal-dependent hydrolase